MCAWPGVCTDISTGVCSDAPAVNDVMVIPADMPSFIVLLQLGCSEPQVVSAGPRIAEAAGAQIDTLQACQLLYLPAVSHITAQ